MAHELAELLRVAALIGPQSEPVIMMVTSTRFGRIVAEMNELEGTDPDLPLRKATPQNCGDLMVGKSLRVVNAGTDDQATVHRVNIKEAERVNFQARRARLQTGRA